MKSAARGTATFVVLGCAKNQVEAEAMTTRLSQAGWELTADIPNASVVVVHTCGFLQAARDEALQTIRRLRKAAPRSFLVMTGCFAQYLGRRQKPKEVDATLGTGEFHKLPDLIARRRLPAVAVSSPSGFHDAEAARPLRAGQLSTYLRVSEGCNHRCTFCIIPQLRGNLKSRAPEDIYAEARGLLDRGVRELVVISQDTTDYGRDLPVRKNLAALLRPMLRWKDLAWLRLLYAYPSEVSEELISLLAGEEKLCGYLDMPLQHISDKILKAMARDWGQKETMGLLERLRARVPHLTLRTTFIVGFPGETDKDFREMLKLVRSGLLDHVGIFPYSPEQRSPSSRADDAVPAEVMEERWQLLLDAHTRVMDKKNEARVGSRIKLLVESDPAGGGWIARGPHQAPEVDGVTRLETWPSEAGFYEAEIMGHEGVDLTARLFPAKHGKRMMELEPALVS